MRKKNDPYEIIRKYEAATELLISTAYGDGGPVNPYPRLHRAMVNQIENGEATVSRYAIWANTVRDNILEYVKLIQTDSDTEKALSHLVTAINSLSCFADIQAQFDPFKEDEMTRPPLRKHLFDL